MKLKRINHLKNIFAGIFLVIILFAFNSCSQDVIFLTSSVVPAARGQVTVKRDKNNNYHVSVSLSDLAESSRLQPPKLTYIVWMVADQEIAKNIGQLNSSAGFISKRLKGNLKTVSSIKPSKVFITAEDDASTQYPGPLIVLTTDSF